MNLASTVKFKKETPFIWELVLLSIARSYYVSDGITTIITLLLFVMIFIRIKKILIPRIKNSNLYVFFIIYATAYGMLMFSTREVTRTLFYLLPTILCIWLGYFLQMAYEHKSIFKTIYLVGILNCVHTILYVLVNIGQIKDITDVREYASGFVFEISIVLVAFYVEKLLFKKVIFGHVIDILVMILFAVKIATSLTRSAIGQAIVGLAVAFILLLIFDFRRINFRMGLGAIIFAATLIAVFAVLPNEAVETFNEKLDNTGTEISSQQKFKTVDDAMANWRGFEMQEAQKQWKNNENGFEVIFGEGLGASINVRFIPYNWQGEIEGKAIPLLHNGFYGVLIYGGVFGVVALIWFLLGGLFLLIKNYKKMEGIREYLIINAATSVSVILATYVVNGVVGKTLFLNWCLICGCTNAMVINYKENKEEETEE